MQNDSMENASTSQNHLQKIDLDQRSLRFHSVWNNPECMETARLNVKMTLVLTMNQIRWIQTVKNS